MCHVYKATFGAATALRKGEVRREENGKEGRAGWRGNGQQKRRRFHSSRRRTFERGQERGCVQAEAAAEAALRKGEVHGEENGKEGGAGWRGVNPCICKS